MPAPLIDKITIIGLGLIGSSIARACHARHVAGSLIGCDRNEISLAYGRKHNVIDTAIPDPAIAVADSSLIILAVPPMALEETAKAIAPRLKPGAVVMDVCSVKQPAIAAIAPHLPAYADFIPAHPIAGSEQSGIGAGRADLFQRKRVVVTPEHPEPTPALQMVTTFWQSLGARVEAMPPHLHDLIYAYVSHLPQLLAFATAPLYAEQAAPDERLQKFLRLSGSNTAMWAEIFQLNKIHVLAALDRYLDAMVHIGKELTQAPEGSPNEKNEAQARDVLFPRLAASCLVTTVMEAEKKAGFPFARYAGTGFADFTTPVMNAPDEDIERISGQFTAVNMLLAEYVKRLKTLRAMLAEENSPLAQALASP